MRQRRREASAAGDPGTMSAADLASGRIVFLTYHEIEPRNSRYSYQLTCNVFEQHLRYLWSDKAAVLPRFALTFDDGHRSQFLHAAPLLKTFAVRAHYFLTAGWIQVRPSSMLWSDVAELARCGHEIGSHGWSHVWLTHCTDCQLGDELLRSKQGIEDKLGRAVTSISMPGGKWNRRVLRACRMAGYTHVFTSDPVANIQVLEGIFVRGRFNVSQSTSIVDLRRITDTSSPWFYVHRLKHGAKRILNRLTGDRIYHAVWSYVSGCRETEPADLMSPERHSDHS